VQPEKETMAFGGFTADCWTSQIDLEQFAHKCTASPEAHLPTRQVMPSQTTGKSKIELELVSDIIRFTIDADTELELHLTNEDAKLD
jgi:hypothetical protein